jgi:hypothetical protein
MLNSAAESADRARIETTFICLVTVWQRSSGHMVPYQLLTQRRCRRRGDHCRFETYPVQLRAGKGKLLKSFLNSFQRWLIPKILTAQQQQYHNCIRHYNLYYIQLT